MNYKILKKNYDFLIKNLKKKSIYNEYCKLYFKYKKELKVKKLAFFMQVGKFYESYAWNFDNEDDTIQLNYEEFKNLSYLLNMLTAKKNNSVKHNLNNPYMFGFPEQVKERHIDRLLDEDYHIVLIHQRDDEKDPKIKIRDQVEIINPSTNINNNNFDNFTMCITINTYRKQYYYCGISLYNLNSNENYIYECNDTKNYTNNVKNKINKIYLLYQPTKIICYNFSNNEETKVIKDLDFAIYNDILVIYDKLENDNLKKITYQRELLKEIYNEDILLSTNIKNYSLNYLTEARLSFIILLNYIGKSNKLLLNNITLPKYVEMEDHLNLDYNTLEQLNIVSMDKKYNKYSLIEILDNTSTVVGKRFLIRRLTNPLTNIEELNMNYDLSEELYEDYLKFEKILCQIHDISKLHKKISYQRISPDNLYVLMKNYNTIIKLYKLSINYKKLKELFNKKSFSIKKLENLVKNFEKIFLVKIKEISGENISNLNEVIFKKGYDLKLKEYIESYEKLLSNKRMKLNELTNFITKKLIKGKRNNLTLSYEDTNLILITKVKSELIRRNKDKYEYLNNIEIIQRGKSKFYLKINSLVEQYNEELKLLEFINQRQNILYKKYLYSLSKYKNYFEEIEYYVGFIDFIKSNIKNSKNNYYNKPEIIDSDKSFFDIIDFRHPIIEKINKDTEYIKNSLKLHDKNGLLLTAMNGLGKSSLLKNIGLCIIMAQSGMYVPSKNMKFFPFKNILTRIKGNDNIFTNSSSFQVEMIELNNIIKNSNDSSLILMDELCRGTEQASSHSLTIGVIEYLLEIQSKFIITTHMHSIFNDKFFNDLKKKGKLLIKHLEVDIKNGELIYKRTLKDGISENIYGLEIARMLGIEDTLIKRCNQIRNNYLNFTNDIVSTKKSKYNSKLYLTKCSLCGKKDQNKLETHHIVEQKESNHEGLIESELYHKNELFNLMVLCTDCHKKITFGKLKTSKKLLSSNGIKVIKN